MGDKNGYGEVPGTVARVSVRFSLSCTGRRGLWLWLNLGSSSDVRVSVRLSSTLQ